MKNKELITRIERLEELAILTHGTLDVDEVRKNIKKFSERAKETQMELDEMQRTREERSKKFQEGHEKWKQEMEELRQKSEQMRNEFLPSSDETQEVEG